MMKCHIKPYSSRMCEIGTKGCEVRHAESDVARVIRPELVQFKLHGDRASYHYADDSAKEWGLADAEKNKALAIFDANKDLQPQMRKIAREFLWGHELNRLRPNDGSKR